MLSTAFLSLVTVKKGHSVRDDFVSGALELFFSVHSSFSPINTHEIFFFSSRQCSFASKSKAFGFLIQSSKPNTQGSFISGYYESKVVNRPSHSVNIWHVTWKQWFRSVKVFYLQSSAILAISHILVQNGLNAEFELWVILN